jgi:hypothetical protein
MPVKIWGERRIVDLDWQGPKMFSINRTPQTIPDYRGVYLLSSRKELYGYPRGLSSLAYIGSGQVARRLPAHVGGNPRVQNALDNESTMWFWYARVAQGLHDCVEQHLFDDFVERHGASPILNIVRPACATDWSGVTVRHSGLRFPYDYSRRNFP